MFIKMLAFHGRSIGSERGQKKRKLKILVRVKAITAVGGRKEEERSPAGGKDAHSTEGKPIRSVVSFHHLWVSESVEIFDWYKVSFSVKFNTLRFQIFKLN